MIALLLAALLQRPNVVVIITDDQGYGDLGCHGNAAIHTPTLDALAARSVRLDRFYSMPVCSPTRAGLMTGRHYYRTGVVDTFIGRSMMRAEETTLAERLGPAGWRTGLFGKWHLGDNFPMRAMDQGFQQTLTLKGGGIGQPSDPPGGDHYQDPTLYKNGAPVKMKGYVSDLITDAAIEFIGARRDAPFYVHLAYNAPHTPLEVPEGSLERYRDLPDVTARVYAMVTNIDANIGRLLAALEKQGLTRDTIVVFMTDNGPQQERYNAGMRGRKGTVFEGGIRVPGYICWPAALAPGRVVKEAASHLDLFPTLLEACGLPRPEKIDGRSLLPLLKGEAAAWPERTLYFQWHRGDAPRLGEACAARGARYKMVRLKPESPAMLFDLEADPEEKNDVAAAHPDILKRLVDDYEAWFKGLGVPEPPRIHVGAPEENPVVLTRQDWRGPRAGWGKESVGHWDLHVARAGRYTVRLTPAGARFTIAGQQAENEATLELPAGPARLEPADPGVTYAEVRFLRQ